MQANKLSAAERLAAIRTKVQKDVAGAAITIATDKPADISVISTGSLLLDRALGVGGYPYGRIIEIYGPESSGKTTLMLHAIAECQRNGGVAAFIDAEHALDLRYAGSIGVNTNELMVVQPDHGEQALACADAFIDEMQAGDIVVVDSVASLVPKAEIEGDVGDSHVGLQARLMSQTLRRIVGKAQKSGVIVMFTNQIRMKIGVMFGCFSYNTRVSLADGTSMKIGKIVNQRLPVEVLSFNPKTGAVEPKKVIDWHDNGQADFFLQFRVSHRSGESTFDVTPNHQIFTLVDGAWKECAADDIEVGSILGYSDTSSECLVPATVIGKTPSVESMHRFDISVEGNHTYLVDGIAVHNSPETTSGGNSLKFYASVRLDIRRIGAVKEAVKGEKDVEVTGNRTRVKVVKNKVAPPFREAEFTIEFGKGISYTEDLLDLAVEYGLIEKSGGWFSYKNEKIGNGRINVVAALQSEDWKERVDDIDAEIRDRIKQLSL